MAEWFEGDSFWEAVYPTAFPPERFLLGDDEVAQGLDGRPYDADAARLVAVARAGN